MSNFQTRKLHQFKEELEPISFMVEDQYSETIVIDYDKAMKFLSTALKEQREEIMNIINREHREYLLSEERKEDCGCNDRDTEHYRVGVDDVCQSILQKLKELGLIE